jgi:uncharacterized OsmC-like protein
VRASPDSDIEKFEEITADAKANCPVSRVLNAKIALEAKLEAKSRETAAVPYPRHKEF